MTKIIIRPESSVDFDANLKWTVEIRKKVNQFLPEAAANTLYPTKLNEAIALAKFESAPYLISLKTSIQRTRPELGGQIIKYFTPQSKLLTAYLQSELASIPRNHYVPRGEYATSLRSIPRIAQLSKVHAIQLSLGFVSNYYDDQLLTYYDDELTTAVARGVVRFLDNNPTNPTGGAQI